ncbi:MAG: hypothetical protein VZR54_03515 [Ruminococcus sp.]|jgi:hypothetical protein|nr:hypothetical protein [Ruminococcus sp.]
MMGSKLLKVIGILMIIFGAIGLVVSLIALGGMALITSALGEGAGMYWFAVILGLLGTIVEFVAGILGVVNWNKPEKAQVCVICGIVSVAFTVLSNILVLVSYAQGFNVFSLVTGLVLPVLYLVGAFQLKKAE